MATLAAINPLDYITEWTPIPEEAMNASGWFEWEYTTIEVGAGGSQLDASIIPWFMAQGWTNTGSRDGTLRMISSTSTQGTTQTVKPGMSSAFGSDKHVVDTTTSTTAKSRIYDFKRRRLQPDRVLQDMINEFTKAYNEGRLLNDRRFDEILSLYDVMLARTEAEITAVANVIAPYDTIVDTILSGLEGQFDEYKEKVEGLVDGYGDSHRTRINTQFDNELSKAQQMLVSRGLHNATIWASVSTGIEQKRAESLTDLEDKILDRTLNVTDRVQTARNDLNTRLENSATKLREMKRSGRFDATDFRNKILTAMLAFAERRTDEYPGISELANIAGQLGFAEGSAVATPQ